MTMLRKFGRPLRLRQWVDMSKSYLVQKYGGRYFAKVTRIDILSKSMEADILKSKKDLFLVQKYGGQYV